VTNVDVDLIAYLTLNEILNSTEDKDIAEDITSKMFVHSKKISSGNSGIKLKL
jgi:hypothetical protein